MKTSVSAIDLQTAIGQRISDLRRDKGMTQRDMAYELDVSIKHCSECERGIAMFSIERLVNICEIFDVSMDYLIRGTPEDKKETHFPPTMIEIFHSGDTEEISLLTDYLNFYAKLRAGNSQKISRIKNNKRKEK